MTEKLSWEDIKNQFPDEWVMLADYEWEEGIDPSEGKVIAHSKSRKEFGELMKKIKIEDAAIVYTGAISSQGLRLWKHKRSQ